MEIFLIFTAILAGAAFLINLSSKRGKQKRIAEYNTQQKQHELYLKQLEEDHQKKRAEYEAEQLQQRTQKAEEEAERKAKLDSQIAKEKLQKYESFINQIYKVEVAISDTPQVKLNVDEMPELKIARAPRDAEQANNLCDFVVIDVETTGLSAKRNKLLEVCAVRFEGFEPVGYMTTFINPKSKIPEKITEINGITDDMVKDAPEIASIYQSFIDFIGKEKNIVAHNIYFDLKFLYANGINLFEVKRKYYDTLQIARARIPEYTDRRAEKSNIINARDFYIENYKLPTLLKFCKIYTPQSHRALSDCIATGQLFKALLMRF